VNLKVLLRGILVLASLAAFGLALEALNLRELMTEHWVDARIRGQGVAGEMLFVGAVAVATGLGLPRQVFAFLGGYAFGLLAGTGLSVAGTVLGCLCAFLYARFLARPLVAHWLHGRMQHLDDFLGGNPFSMTLLIRLLPVGSNLVTNLAAGVSSVRFLPFVAGSAVGFLPQNLVFALAGSGVATDPLLRVGLAVALFIVSGMLGVRLYRRFRHGKAFDDAVEREIEEPHP
jgi:uncharacterized membrane protein YdjX (TVP38/TMEM64 family)